MYYNYRAEDVTEATGTIAKSGVIKYTFLDPRVTYVPQSFSRNEINASRHIIIIMVSTPESPTMYIAVRYIKKS